jgi:hypothetical protein
MVERIFMGNHPSFGTGLYVSKPGSDVRSPGTNLLLDSRFRQMRILTRGIASMSRFGESTGTFWYATVTFPDLGYVPMFWASIIYQSSNWAGLPVNSSAYPAPDCGETDTGSLQITFASTWIEGTNVLKSKARVGVSNGSGNMAMNYIIFSNPQDG